MDTPDLPPRLLILRCASRKLDTPGFLPALARYDGPTFRILRKYLRTEPADPPVVRIISAEHGLMSDQQPIAEYDRRMTPERAVELRPAVQKSLQELVHQQPFREVLVVVGQTYLLALDGIEEQLTGIPVRIAGETQGRKLGVLRAWLYGEPTDTPRPTRRPATSQPRQLGLLPSEPAKFKVGGTEFLASPEDALAAARQALASHDPAATRILRWFLPLDGQRISPKWLVGKLSGVPTSRFQADSARSILVSLGLELRETTQADDIAS